jgi:hypothetical protein
MSPGDRLQRHCLAPVHLQRHLSIFPPAPFGDRVDAADLSPVMIEISWVIIKTVACGQAAASSSTFGVCKAPTPAVGSSSLAPAQREPKVAEIRVSTLLEANPQRVLAFTV